MLRTFGKSRRFRTIIVGFLAGVAALALAVDSADAKGKRRSAKKGGGYNPPYSAIVVDANSGGVLHAADADGIRHPASLTKIMTLYLLFEQIEAGKIKPDTPLKVSAHAAAQSPTKLGLKAGDTITAEDAIRGLVTKSANDAAVAIAEALAGDEEEFAKQMTRKARALGMSRTVYMNANGLPDRDQVTTARDQALLGRAIQDRFPRQYRYFSTKSFTFRGKTMGNHNHLLGSVQGVDGIKTGYINASGFNLVASMKRNNRSLVAVVLGGSSGGARDARMRSLLEKHIADASAGRTAPMIAEARDGEVETAPVAGAPAGDASHAVPASAAAPMPATPINSTRSERAAAAPAPKAGSGAVDPIKPIAVRTIKVKLNGVQTASLTPPLAHLPVVAVKDEPAMPKAAAQPAQTVATKAAETHATRAQPAAPAAQAAATAEPASGKPAVAPATPIQAVAASPAAAAPAQAPVQVASAAPTIAVPAPAPVQVALAAQTASAPAPAPIQVASAEPTISVSGPAPTETAGASEQSAARKVVHSGWVIQVGAFEAEREAKDRLSSAQTKAKHLLARADAFTETVVKDNRTFFRARFAGFEKDEAEAACKYLKRNDFACMTLKN